MMWPPRGCHVGPGAEVAPCWRRGGQATSARRRRSSGNTLAGATCHGEGREWYQKDEEMMPNMMLTRVARMRGGKVVGDEVERRRF